MARHYGIGLARWGIVGGGKLQTKSQIEERKKKDEGLRSFMSGEQSEQEAKIPAALEEERNELGGNCSISGVALAYVMAKVPRVFPVVGGRKIKHPKDNIKAFEMKLTDKQIEEFKGATPFDIGFPSNFAGEDSKINYGKGGFILANAAYI